MASEIKLNLKNKRLIFAVSKFIHTTKLEEKELAGLLEAVQLAAKAGEDNDYYHMYELLKVVAGPLSQVERQLDVLLATLADVDVSVIEDLEVTEYGRLLISFFKVDSLKQLSKSQS